MEYNEKENVNESKPKEEKRTISLTVRSPYYCWGLLWQSKNRKPKESERWLLNKFSVMRDPHDPPPWLPVSSETWIPNNSISLQGYSLNIETTKNREQRVIDKSGRKPLNNKYGTNNMRDVQGTRSLSMFLEYRRKIEQGMMWTTQKKQQKNMDARTSTKYENPDDNLQKENHNDTNMHRWMKKAKAEGKEKQNKITASVSQAWYSYVVRNVWQQTLTHGA